MRLARRAMTCTKGCDLLTMRAWPVARSIFDAPYVREANERTTSWIMTCRLITYRQRFARAAPAPRAKNRGRASPVKIMTCTKGYIDTGLATADITAKICLPGPCVGLAEQN